MNDREIEASNLISSDLISEVPSFDPAGMMPIAPAGFKSGFVALIGRPNVGKSTLMNQMIGQKIAITSPVAQTTRNRLRGILTGPTSQIIFVDTPGIHKPHHQLGKVLVQNAKQAIDAVDLIVFVVDASVPAGGGDRYVADLLSHAQTPVIVGLNKIDQQSETAEHLDATYQALVAAQGWNQIKFSALTGEGITDLDTAIQTVLPEGPYYYPPDLVTDQPERFIMGELIREQILHLTREEVPHSVAIVIEQVKEETEITRVFATIYVERTSQKGILIGKGGQMLKQIGVAARVQIQKLIAGKIYLELFVKVQPQWRQSRLQLTELGYRVES
jgi:GTP-binding protein Era